MFTSVTPFPGIKSAAILEIFFEALSNTSALDENDVTSMTIAIKYFLIFMCLYRKVTKFC